MQPEILSLVRNETDVKKYTVSRDEHRSVISSQPCLRDSSENETISRTSHSPQPYQPSEISCPCVILRMPFKAFSLPRFRQKLRHEGDKPLDSGNASSPSVAHESMPGPSRGSGKLEPGCVEASNDSSSVFVSEVVREAPPVLVNPDFQATLATQGTLSCCS